jgi:hypothetical protein
MQLARARSLDGVGTFGRACVAAFGSGSWPRVAAGNLDGLVMQLRAMARPRGAIS